LLHFCRNNQTYKIIKYVSHELNQIFSWQKHTTIVFCKSDSRKISHDKFDPKRKTGYNKV